MTIVTGSEPAVLQHFCRALGVIVISEHYDIALYAYFAVAELVGIVDFNIDTRELQSCGVIGIAFFTVCSNKR